MSNELQEQVKENQIVKSEPRELKVSQMNETSIFFDSTSFEFAMRVSKMFAESNMIPAHFQKNIPNIMIAMNFAMRNKLDPFMAMQNMYVISGKPGIESKLAVTLMKKSGEFSDLEYEFSGEGDSRQCVAYAKRLSTGTVLRGTPVTIEMAKGEGWYGKSGSKWKTMPEQMLAYRAAAFFIKLHAPDVLIGMNTKEEMEDITLSEPIEEKTVEVNLHKSAKEKKHKGLVIPPANASLKAEPIENPEQATEEDKDWFPPREPEPAGVGAAVEFDLSK